MKQNAAARTQHAIVLHDPEMTCRNDADYFGRAGAV
jgi:hypothetical protein